MNPTNDLISAFLQSTAPKPTVSEAPCDMCHQLTNKWSSSWKTKKLIFRCDNCREKARIEQEKLTIEAFKNLKI